MSKQIKVLILGSSGMLGSTLSTYLSTKKNFHIYAVQRSKSFKNRNINFIYLKKFEKNKIYKIISLNKPKYVINCAGIINHKINNNISEAIYMNSYFPKVLYEASKIYKFYFIHISTDCVFDGKIGNYTEKSTPNAQDTYGRSKLIGEIFNKNSITIRTSIFGHEIKTKYGLLEWFLNAKKIIKGYKNFFFTGITTLELSKIIHRYIIKDKIINGGLFHIGGRKISKLHLLKTIKKHYNKPIQIVPQSYPKINKCLNSKIFRKKTGYKFTSLKIMINEMKIFNEKFF